MPTTYTGFAFAVLKPSEASPTSLTDSRVVVIAEITAGETVASAKARFGSVAPADKLLASTLLYLTDVTPGGGGGTDQPSAGGVSNYTDKSLLNLVATKISNTRYKVISTATNKATGSYTGMYLTNGYWKTEAELNAAEFPMGYPLLVQLYWVAAGTDPTNWRQTSIRAEFIATYTLAYFGA